MTAPTVPPTVKLLVVAADGDEFVLGRHDLGLYVTVPEPGAVFVNALRAGESVAEATAKATAVAGEEVDGADFLQTLTEAGLFDEPGTAPDSADAGAGNRRGRRIRWIEGVPPGAVSWLFGPVAWCGYGAAALAVVGILVTRPDLRPSFENFWFLPDPVLSTLVLLPISFVLIGLHEVWHWLAGRAVGVSAIFRVSYRGIYLVFETDLSQLATVPRRRRYSPFLAGMAFDVSVLLIALVARLLYSNGVLPMPGLVNRVLGTVVLIESLGIVWQLAGVFLRSDTYAVLANALRCHNLYLATWLTVKQRLWRLSKTDSTQLDEISDHDRKVARWFALVYAAGLVVQLWVILQLGLPYLIGMSRWIFDNLAAHSLTSGAFWACVVAALLVLANYAGPPLLAIRERRLRRRGELL